MRLRFINHPLVPLLGFTWSDYLQVPPRAPESLDLSVEGFLYADTLRVPNTPLALRVTRTAQAPQAAGDDHIGLILDIEVFTVEPCELNESMMRQRLAEMRWLKNKAFFGSITKKLLERLR